MPRAVLLLFAKLPIPGRCKTRLAEKVGRERAAELATAFLLDSIDRLSGFDRDLVLLGDQADPTSFRALTGPAVGWRYADQGRGTLGDRLDRAFRGIHRDGRPAVAFGADAPHLPASEIERAIATVESGSTVLGPSTDGGYYLLGLPPVSSPGSSWGDLFAHDRWGTAEVLDRARGILSELNDRPVELAPFSDIDTFSDLEQWTERMRIDPEGAAVASRSAELAARVVAEVRRSGSNPGVPKSAAHRDSSQVDRHPSRFKVGGETQQREKGSER